MLPRLKRFKVKPSSFSEDTRIICLSFHEDNYYAMVRRLVTTKCLLHAIDFPKVIWQIHTIDYTHPKKPRVWYSAKQSSLEENIKPSVFYYCYDYYNCCVQWILCILKNDEFSKKCKIIYAKKKINIKNSEKNSDDNFWTVSYFLCTLLVWAWNEVITSWNVWSILILRPQSFRK